MTWKSSVLVRLGSEQRKTSAPLSLRASRSASKISGGTSFLDMNTLEPLKAIVFIAGVYLRNPSDVGFWVGKRNQVTRGFGKDGIAFVLCRVIQNSGGLLFWPRWQLRNTREQIYIYSFESWAHIRVSPSCF